LKEDGHVGKSNRLRRREREPRPHHRGRGGRRRRKRGEPHDRRRAAGREVPRHQHRRAGAVEQSSAHEDPDRREAHERARRRRAATEDTEKICEALDGSDMVFITTGLGGGTGTGAAPVVASIAKRLGGDEQRVLTVAVVTLPFALEGKKRMEQAREGLAELKK